MADKKITRRAMRSLTEPQYRLLQRAAAAHPHSVALRNRWETRASNTLVARGLLYRHPMTNGDTYGAVLLVGLTHAGMDAMTGNEVSS